MPDDSPQHRANTRKELGRYVVNGVFATGVHFSILALCLRIPGWPSAGLANLIAAFFGITSSFFGNRHFVFRNRIQPFFTQGTKFLVLYGAIALLHGATLGLTTDLLKIDYRIGFLIATGLQLSLSYGGNKKLVFNQ
jgi:putative flippase GtrA